MKSCLGLLFTVLVFALVIGGGALIWYLSYSAEFPRTGAGEGTGTSLAPTGP